MANVESSYVEETEHRNPRYRQIQAQNRERLFGPQPNTPHDTSKDQGPAIVEDAPSNIPPSPAHGHIVNQEVVGGPRRFTEHDVPVSEWENEYNAKHGDKSGATTHGAEAAQISRSSLEDVDIEVKSGIDEPQYRRSGPMRELPQPQNQNSTSNSENSQGESKEEKGGKDDKTYGYISKATCLSSDIPLDLEHEEKKEEDDKATTSRPPSSHSTHQTHTQFALTPSLHPSPEHSPARSGFKRSGRASPPKRPLSHIPLATHSMAPIKESLVGNGSHQQIADLPPAQRRQIAKRQSRVTMVKRPETPSPITSEQRNSLYAPLGEMEVERERREHVKNLRKVKSDESPRATAGKARPKSSGAEWVSNFTFTPEDKNKKRHSQIQQQPVKNPKAQERLSHQPQQQPQPRIKDMEQRVTKNIEQQAPQDPKKKQDRISRYLKSRSSVALMDNHPNVSGFQFPPDPEREAADVMSPHLHRPRGHLDQEERRMRDENEKREKEERERKGWPYAAVEDGGKKGKEKEKQGLCGCVVM
ncbi:hypothetical protein BDV96DRAFT_688034 [Lophiotrema nucula]|uniref:Uncharacterized protein n=1 Tax=Lophiotrema nucula TaxID=690887 RepID=A0A6A5Z663_9PLEO|nr:hypothetical protein BDV96DRAFT_688034 [Lophiotrema nucula]